MDYSFLNDNADTFYRVLWALFYKRAFCFDTSPINFKNGHLAFSSQTSTFC